MFESVEVPLVRSERRAGVPLPSPALTTLVVLLADALALLMAFGASSPLWGGVRPGNTELAFFQPWMAFWLFPIVFACSGLYPGAGVRPPEELKRLIVDCTLVHLMLAASSFLFAPTGIYSRGVLLTSWLLSLVLVPLARTIVRDAFAKKSWWGVPVVVLGGSDMGHQIVKDLIEHPAMGFKPIAIFESGLQDTSERFCGIPIHTPLTRAPQFAEALKVKHAILCLPEVSQSELIDLVQVHAFAFPYLILVPRFLDALNLSVSTRDLGDVLGLEVKQNLLFPRAQAIKRILDIVLTAIGGTLILPLLLLIAIGIKLDSPGSVLFAQERLGRDGKRFKALKFRSMYRDAEAKLHDLLQQNPELRREYDIFHKLRHDPRVTPLGRFLRKYSLDELPQLWNVLRGEMSLVGPRAYLPREIEHMCGRESIVLKVLPGITGLWQVRARNTCSFHERIEMDIYYVRNWSLSLDLYLLLSTIKVVLQGRGAF